jgi:hypothetical protein
LARRLCEIQLNLVDETPTPIFARLDGPHNRVLDRVKVLRGVLVLRGIAATNISADHAEPQMNPRVAHFYAFFAYVNFRLPNFDLIHMRARSR